MVAKTSTTGLGTTIRKRRLEIGLTLQELASRVGVHFTTVSSWERGRSFPAYDAMPRLANALGTTAQDLFGGLWVRAGPGEGGLAVLRAIHPADWDRFRRSLESVRFALALESARKNCDLPVKEVASRTGLELSRVREILTAAADPTVLEALSLASAVRLRVLPPGAEPVENGDRAGASSPGKKIGLNEIRAGLKGLPDGPREQVLALLGRLLAWMGR